VTPVYVGIFLRSEHLFWDETHRRRCVEDGFFVTDVARNFENSWILSLGARSGTAKLLNVDLTIVARQWQWLNREREGAA
jgi:hypothetical protein